MRYNAFALLGILALLTFSFLPSTAVAETEWKIYKLSYKDQVFKIPYKISNGDIKSVEMEPDFVTMIMFIESDPVSDGAIEVTIPRQLVDPGGGLEEQAFIILLDGEEVDYQEVMNSPCFRTISFGFPAGSREMEIIASIPIGRPEYGRSLVDPVYVATDKNNYERGEEIKISGCTSLALDDKEVILEVLNPEGKIYRKLSVTPNIDGSFSASLPLEGELAINGSYTVKATYAGYTYVPEFPLGQLLAFAASISIIILIFGRTKHLLAKN